VAERHSDELMKTAYAVALIIVLGFAIGFGIFWFFHDSIPIWVGEFKQLVTPLYTAWMKIPGALQTLIVGAIPTALMFFFAWTKSRAMQKLEETKQQASQTTQQMEGMKEGAQQTTGAIVDKVSELKDQLHHSEEAYKNVLSANELLEKEKKLLTEQLIRARSDRDTLQSKLEAIDLEKKLAERVA